MGTTFDITPDRDFLQHFLTRWRTKSISPEMVEKLKAGKDTDPYAAYGYGRWLSLVNPGGAHIKEAEVLLLQAGSNGVQDANAALAQMYHDGRIEADEANPGMHAFLMDSSYRLGSELAQFMTLENTVYGEYGFEEDPAMAADILRGHLEKNPGADPIYYDLLGQALEKAGQEEAAEKAYRTSLERGETESYYSLANLYSKQGDEEKAWAMAGEGAREGAVNCHRFKAGMDQERFLEFSPEQQEALHLEIAEGLDFAIARHDTYACFLKGSLLYLGNLGYPEDEEAALEPLERGCEMGAGNCYWLKADILNRNGGKDVAKNCLQAVRLGYREQFTLEQVARGYVSGELSKHEKEIEQLWLKEYVKANPEEEDSADAQGVVAVYPQGFYYAMDVEEEGELDLDPVCSLVEARGFDVVHYSTALTRITKALGLEGCHVAMLVDKDGYMKDLPDNMPGTLVYGQGHEIRGTVVFVLEDDKSYTLMPMKGLQRTYMFLQLLSAATGDLVRQPTSEELEAIGAEDPGGFEEYDDDEAYDDPDIFDGAGEPEREIEEDMVSRDTSADAEPRELTVSADRVLEGVAACNLCIDTLFVTLPDAPQYAFLSAEDLFLKLDIKEAVEENIDRHGGYMIDEWRYVDARQVPMDIRSRVRFGTVTC